MENSYIDEETNQAFCIWQAPDRGTVETLFEKAGVEALRINKISLLSA